MDLLRTAEIPLAVYAHFPWCVRKCPYCDFNSHRAPSEIPETRYIDALLADLRHDLDSAVHRPITAIFLGGGTPSLFSPDGLHRFVTEVKRLTAVSAVVEVTMEANPGTIERGRFADYRAAGINRVSLGAQSFDDAQLQKLGRIHGAQEIRAAAEELHAAGIDNFNIDLMFGLPGQSIAAAISDIETAVSLHPAHISHYQLTLEPGTAFFFRPPVLPTSDESWDMQHACQVVLAAAGYEQYEVSAYARKGHQCLHNLNYWRFGDYFGLGAGAHGKLSNSGGIVRTERRKQPRDYLERVPADRLTVRPVPQSEVGFEFMLNALRLRGGFKRQEFRDRTGMDAATLGHALTLAQQRELLAAESDGYKPTELGMRFLNDLQALFLP